MKFRKLRIAWSVGWGIICVLLVVLWVRSYWWHDWLEVRVTASRTICGYSETGYLAAGIMSPSSYHPEDILLRRSLPVIDKKKGKPGWHVAASCPYYIVVPHWLTLIVVGLLGISPKYSYRFSLRALLIATTFIALALGTIVWLAHR